MPLAEPLNSSPMTIVAVVIFGLTYTGVALGRVPRLILDRTGIALLGAIAMVVSGALSLTNAVTAIDVPTIILLYALMVVSAQLRLGGFYTWVALRMTRWLTWPRPFLAALMAVSAVLSALLANDIICLAFTPVVTLTVLHSGLNPIPFLLGLAVASNVGSAATIIGNPQNMLIGQWGSLRFDQFLAWCGPPSLVALIISYALICWLFRGRFKGVEGTHLALDGEQAWPHFNAWQSGKGLAATLVLIALFFTSFPRELSALGIAGILLCSRKISARSKLDLIDWHLISLFCALFIVIEGIAQADVPAQVLAFLSAYGIHLRDVYALTIVSTVTSNLFSNVPATMLLTRFLDQTQPVQWYVLAVSSTFAGNLIVIGSIANLIVIEQAQHFGVKVSFREHARVGIPVTLATLAVLVGWIMLTSR